MARLVPLALLLAGCLYTDDLNTPPTIALTINHGPPQGTFTVGTSIEVEAEPQDRGEDGGVLSVKFDFFDEHGATPYQCEGQKFDGSQTATFVFFVAGTYTVVATTTDNRHARSAPATATILITDPALSVTGVVEAEPLPACGAYPAGGPIGLNFAGHVNDTRGDGQPDDPTCTPLSVPDKWQVTSADGTPTNAVLTLAHDDTDCTGTRSSNDSSNLSAPDSMRHVCLWPDPNAGAMSYVVSFDVHAPDGNSPSKTILVGADQPPCIKDTNIAGGSYIVDHAGSFTAQVTKLADDYDPYGSPNLTYRWSVWVPDATSANGGSWIVVASGAGLASYTLDLGAFDLGDQPRLRVEARDRTNRPATCADSQMQCCQASCNYADADCPGAAQCKQWVTWELELR